MKIKIFKKKVNRSTSGNIAIWTILILFASIMTFPLVYAIGNSLKPMDEFFVFPPRFLPTNPTLNNFADLFSIFDNSEVPFGRYVFNTVLVSTAGTTGQVLLASAAAYAVSKLRFPGRKFLFSAVTVSLMFNSTITSVANFITLRTLGMVDTYWAVIIPSFASPLGLFLMKQFMDQMIPDALIEAARIDGASEYRIFFGIAFPMVKPAWLTLIMFSFQTLWNAGSTAYVYKEELKTVNYALTQIQAVGISRAGAAAAGTVIMLLVPILVFMLTQSNVLETMATSGMKD